LEPASPTVHQVRELPSSYERVVPQEWTDGNGHLTMARYLTLHDHALWPYNATLGMGQRYRDVVRRGTFTLEQHINYHAEVLVGHRVTVHCRLLERTSKLVHGICFVVNATREEVANTMEYVTANVNLDRRSVTDFDEDVAARLDQELESHLNLGWTAGISRSIHVDRANRSR
jgi:acyl-CoA thioester hydrolase